MDFISSGLGCGRREKGECESWSLYKETTTTAQKKVFCERAPESTILPKSAAGWRERGGVKMLRTQANLWKCGDCLLVS
jgi:hypothetical protein